jgi:hypothetical protein
MPMPLKQKVIRWYTQDIHRGSALLAFLVLAFGIAFALAAVEGQSNRGFQDNRESRKALIVSGRAVAVVACNRNYDTIKVLRDILIAAKAGESNERGAEFYDTALKNLKLPDCRDVLMTLSDDVNQGIKTPKPLFEKK